MNVKRILSVTCLILHVALILTGCGGKPQPGSVAGKPENLPASSDPTEPSSDKPGASGSYKKMGDLFDAWAALSGNHESVMGELEQPIRLVLLGGELATCVQYELFNEDNKNGRFEGRLLDRYPGFIEKKDSELIFGYEDILTEDWFPLKAGDKEMHNGRCDLDKGLLEAEWLTLSGENKIARTCIEFKEIKKGEMICLRTDGSKFDETLNEHPWTICTYIRLDKDKMDFVLGESALGASFEKLSIADKGVLTKEEAVEMMEDAGFEIQRTGSIANGQLSTD